MREFYFRKQTRPRVLGLTASPVKGKINHFHQKEMINAETFAVMSALSRFLDAEYAPVPSYASVASTLPDAEIIIFQAKEDPHSYCVE